MKTIYSVSSGYEEEGHDNGNITTSFYATKKLAKKAFESILKDVYEKDDIHGRSYDKCMEDLSYYDPSDFALYVDEVNLYDKVEEVD